MIFIAPRPKDIKAAINKNDERNGISEKGKKRRMKIREEIKLKIAPPALYRTYGIFHEYSGGAIKHCPPVPGRVNLFTLILPSFLMKVIEPTL